MNLAKDKVVSQIISRLASPERGVVLAEGTWGSYARLLAAHVASTLKRPILHICPHIDDADKAFDDLKTFGAGKVELLPAWEGEEELADATDETRSERLRIVSLLGDEAIPPGLVITAPAQALCQPVAKPAAMRACQLNLQADATMDPEAIVEWLVNNSFERVDAIDLPGQFARRGGIIDIYAPLAGGSLKSAGLGDGRLGGASNHPQASLEAATQKSQAVRLEFFGDTVESIRQIDLDSQRSTDEMGRLSIMAATCGSLPDQRELFTNILPADAIIVFEEPADVEEVTHTYLARAENTQRLYSWADIHNSAGRLSQLQVCRFGAAEPGQSIKVDVKSVQQFEHKATSLWAGHKAALEDLIERTKEGYHVTLYCDSPAEIH